MSGRYKKLVGEIMEANRRGEMSDAKVTELFRLLQGAETSMVLREWGTSSDPVPELTELVRELGDQAIEAVAKRSETT